jgi:hypothetical protein
MDAIIDANDHRKVKCQKQKRKTLKKRTAIIPTHGTVNQSNCSIPYCSQHYTTKSRSAAFICDAVD